LNTGQPVGSGHAGLRSREDDLRSVRQPFVVATVVRALRPTSAKAGDRALVLPDGTIEGFVGGDCAESSVRLHGLRVLTSGEAVMLRIVPDEDPAGSNSEGLVTVANPCASGGMLEIFLEGVFPAPLIQVHGDGPTARALHDVASALGYEFAPVAPDGQVQPDAAAVVVASHGRGEEPVLAAALAAGIPYVGLVASRKRGAQVLARLAGADDAARQRVHTPAGLDIGARTPPEIALSILAEIIGERPRRSQHPGAGQTPPAAARSGQHGGLAGAGPAGAGPAGVSGPGGLSGTGPVTATDPVCGMSVAVTEATPQLPHDRGIWYFCGSGCKQAFASDPGRYLTRQT
jgi:xanthine dehydrogenase accessory factor